MGKTITVVKNKKPRKPRVVKPKMVKDNITQTQRVVVNVGHVAKPRAPRKPRVQKPPQQQQVSVQRPAVVSQPHTSVYNPPSIFNKDAQKEVNQISELLKSLQAQKAVVEEQAKPNALEKTKPKIKQEVEENDEQFEYDKLLKADRKKPLKGIVVEPFKEVQTTSLIGELRRQPNYPAFVENPDEESQRLGELARLTASYRKEQERPSSLLGESSELLNVEGAKSFVTQGTQTARRSALLGGESTTPSLVSALKPSRYKSALTEGLRFGRDQGETPLLEYSGDVVRPVIGGELFPPLKVPVQATSLLASVEQPVVFEEVKRQPQAELEVEPAFISVTQAPTQGGELELGFSLVPAMAEGGGGGITELNLGEGAVEPPPPEPPQPYEGSAKLPPVEQKDLRALVNRAEDDDKLFPKVGKGLAEQVSQPPDKVKKVKKQVKDPEFAGEGGGKKEYTADELQSYWTKLLKEGKFKGLTDDYGNPLSNTKYVTDAGIRSTKHKEQHLQNIRQVEPSFGL